MIYHLALILLLQLIGEVTSQAFDLVIPGPVIGMVLFVILMIASPRLAEQIRGTAMGLLAHLSLLFVPAGVGVVGHLNTLGDQAGVIMIAIICSTVLAMIVGCYTFLIVAKLTGSQDG